MVKLRERAGCTRDGQATRHFRGPLPTTPEHERHGKARRNGAAEVSGVRIDDAQLWYPPQPTYLVTDISVGLLGMHPNHLAGP
ncbi:hypothetical protein CLCR_01772 [Cladophialophora carrionii]|uniref:Uncharacterized protein n=1 Tax=Cladophialophora carrionii TaxID=86049 RepID=A0A1C1CB99_9EURO|nr:hypothetical protein CLCR_01772 [Cladophialophora carrionii]